MAKTPAMIVVLTAPRPTSRMPSFPSGRGDCDGFHGGLELYHPGRAGPAGRAGLVCEPQPADSVDQSR